jgi:hypothetical protein
MSFNQYAKEEIARGLDETCTEEGWAQDTPGKKYFETIRVTAADYFLPGPRVCSSTSATWARSSTTITSLRTSSAASGRSSA